MASNLEGQGEEESTSTSTMMTDEENTGLSSCQLALQNDLVLRNIFGFLPLPDLKACRLVNQKWKQACQDGCVKKCDTIGFFKSVDNVDFCKAHRIQEMPDLTELISTSGDAFPCRSFLVECGIAGMVENPEKEADLASFLTAIAPNAKQLWLDKLGRRSLFNGEPTQNLQFPRLKSLELWVGRYSVKECLASNLNFCRDIIRYSPLLATLELVFTRSKSKLEAANLLISLLESVQGRKLSLNLHGPLNDILFNRMTGFGLQLRGLWLSFGSGSLLSEDGHSLTKFLKSQSDSLEVLHLRSGKNLRGEISINFPRMEKITHLCLEMQLWRVTGGLRFSRISYAEHFPALNSLSLPKFTDWDSIFDSQMEPVYTVTSLTLPCHLMNPELISKAARIFPNVKKLTLPSFGPVVREPYQAWQNVEELTIVTEGADDLALPIDSADNVLFMLINSIFFSKRRLLAFEDYFQPMGFLQNLKVLRLQHKNRLAISDNACHLILLRLRSLRCLDLSEGSSEKISKEMLQQMRDKFSVLC